MDTITRSPPVWGAWVEIQYYKVQEILEQCRPPCGGRGLKSQVACLLHGLHLSPPVWGAWVEIPICDKKIRKTGVAPRVGGVG